MCLSNLWDILERQGSLEHCSSWGLKSQSQLSWLNTQQQCSVQSLSHVYSFQPHWLQHARLLRTWNSPGKNTGVSSHSFLQGVFLTQGSNPGLLHCKQILYCLSQQGSSVLSLSLYIYICILTQWHNNCLLYIENYLKKNMVKKKVVI